MASPPIYRRLADHYLCAIRAGTLALGDRMPSVRALMRSHDVSLSTALQVCQHLESLGWLEARPRSGYFVRHPRRASLMPAAEPQLLVPPDPAEYVGIHARVSAIIARGQQQPVRTNFSSTVCAPELYPGDALREGAIRALRQEPGILASATGGRRASPFRTVVAKRALDNGIHARPDEVVVTYGCTEALHLALRAVARAGDTIAVESPTYFGLLQALESLGLRTLEIPTSPHTGISLEALELAVQTHDNIRAVVVMPNLQNPLGSIMPDAHKERLVAFCEQQGIPLIEDDTYSGMAAGDVALLAAKAWDRSGNVIYCASINKMLAPGLRLGWMLAGRWHARVAMLKYAQTHHNEEVSQAAAAAFMASSAYDRHLRRLRARLGTQRERMAEAVATYFPAGTRLSVPRGGTVLWIELPERRSSELVFEAALREGIRIAPGLMFSNSNRFDHFIRINCGTPYSQEIDAALRCLGAITAAAPAGPATARGPRAQPGGR